MANVNVNYDVTNLMIPAFGAVRMITSTFNPTNGYVFDNNGLIIDSIPFLPQSVTIDASDVPLNQSVTFTIRQIKFKKIIQGGNTITFNFPSIKNMIIDIVPSNGSSEVRGFFYNFPNFTDAQAQPVVINSGGSSGAPLPVNPVIGTGVMTQSTLTVTNSGVVTIPINANRKYLLLQNKDTTGIVYVSLSGNAGVTALNGFTIQPGGSIELANYVPFGAITLIGSIASNANVIFAEGI